MVQSQFLLTLLQWSFEEAKDFFTECAQTAIHSNSDQEAIGEKQPEQLIQINEVCQILKISKPTVHEWKRSGKIPFYRIGRRIYFKRSEVFNALQKSKERRFGK